MEKIEHQILKDGLVQRQFVTDDSLVVDSRQDITQSLEYAQALRNDDDVWKSGVKAGFAHAAHIPSGVVHELLAIGINVYTAPMKDIVRGLYKINREACLTTRKRVA